MLDLAMNESDGPVLLKELAKRQGLSSKYLEQLVGPLRRAGLVKSKRGVKGGFLLSRPPQEIRLLEVVEAVEGPLVLVRCVLHPEGCPRHPKCATTEIWGEVTQGIRDVLSRTTLADLMTRQRAKEGGTAQ
jgi:Rrf2 family protein